jgi:hypothetical protein
MDNLPPILLIPVKDKEVSVKDEEMYGVQQK